MRNNFNQHGTGCRRSSRQWRRHERRKSKSRTNAMVIAHHCYVSASLTLRYSLRGEIDVTRHRLVLAITFVFGIAMIAASPEEPSEKPQYNKGGELLRPENYREWIFLSSGLGMNYSPAPGSHDKFTNLFMRQWAYKEFLKSVQWPDQTTFVVEERGAQTKGSINKHGNFQTTELMGIGVEVKDASLPDKWAYFNFDDNKTATAN